MQREYVECDVSCSSQPYHICRLSDLLIGRCYRGPARTSRTATSSRDGSMLNVNYSEVCIKSTPSALEKHFG
jgi:hypothetical protein